MTLFLHRLNAQLTSIQKMFDIATDQTTDVFVRMCRSNHISKLMPQQKSQGEISAELNCFPKIKQNSKMQTTRKFYCVKNPTHRNYDNMNELCVSRMKLMANFRNCSFVVY